MLGLAQTCEQEADHDDLAGAGLAFIIAVEVGIAELHVAVERRDLRPQRIISFHSLAFRICH